MKYLFFLTILFFSSHSIAQNELTTKWIEETLTDMGYTKNMPTDEIEQSAVTTLEAICDRTGRCTEQMFQYMNSHPNTKIWPLLVSANDISKKQCKSIISTLATCAKLYEKYNNFRNLSRCDVECNKLMNELGPDYSKIKSYNGKILKLKNDYYVCSDQKLSGKVKIDYQYLSGLGRGGNPFSPDYSAKEAQKMKAASEKARQKVRQELED